MKDYGEWYGRGDMTSGLAAFQPLKLLTVGLNVKGDVQEKASGGAGHLWHYDITIAERRHAQDSVLGEVVIIKEHRSASGFSSDREAHLDLQTSELIYSRYSDSSGKKRECKLVALESGG